LFEKCLLTRIISYLEAHNVIPAHQFGFRQNHGTIEQVNRITSEILTAFEHREYCRAIFLDVSEAFDRVWLDGLMHKIKTHEQLTTSTFADDTAILSRSRCPGRATSQLANHLSVVERWLFDWRIKINEQKCIHITFTVNRQTCPPLSLNVTQIPQVNDVT